MNVLLVSSNSSATGGGELYLLYLARGLKECGHSVVVLISCAEYMDPIVSLFDASGIRVVRDDLLGLRGRPLRFVGALADWRQILKLRRTYRRLLPDVVHVNQQYDEDGLDYILAAKTAGLPVVGTIHLPMCSRKRLRPFGRIRILAMGWWYHLCRYQRIFVSSGAMNEFTELYFGMELAHAISNGVAERGSNGSEERVLPLAWAAKNPVVGFLGRLDDQKNPLLLVEAWFLLRRHLPGCQLVLVGDGPLRQSLEAWARQRHVENEVHITGWLSDPSAWWPLIDVFAMTSDFEGMSLALLEAIHWGKRIVVTQFAGLREVASKARWVKVVSERTPECVASALRTAIAEELPGELEVRAAVEYFSASRMASETADVYARARDAR